MMLLSLTFTIQYGQVYGAINISNTADPSVLPQLSVSGNKIFMVWIESDNDTGDFEIYFTRSTNNGVTFSTPINISNNSTVSDFEPKLAVAGSKVYVIWETLSGDGLDNDIYFTRSTNNGVTFSTPIKIGDDVGANADTEIIASGNNIHVVWDNNSSGNNEIFYSRSTNNGASFSNPLKISNELESDKPQLAVSGSKIYVAWFGNGTGTNGTSDSNADVFFRKSTNYGAIFSSEIQLNDDKTNSVDPQMAISGNNVYVTWGGSGSDTYFAKSANGGKTFSNELDLSNNATGSTQIATSGNNVYVVWSAVDDVNNPISSSIYFSKSTNKGVTFTTPAALDDQDNVACELLAAVKKNVYVGWKDNDSSEIQFARSTNNGITFN